MTIIDVDGHEYSLARRSDAGVASMFALVFLAVFVLVALLVVFQG